MIDDLGIDVSVVPSMHRCIIDGSIYRSTDGAINPQIIDHR